MLIDVLEDAELAPVEREFLASLKVLMLIQSILFVFLLGGDGLRGHLVGQRPVLLLRLLLEEVALDVWSMESLKILILPVQLEVGEPLDALSMIQVLCQDRMPRACLGSIRHGLFRIRVGV